MDSPNKALSLSMKAPDLSCVCNGRTSTTLPNRHQNSNLFTLPPNIISQTLLPKKKKKKNKGPCNPLHGNASGKLHCVQINAIWYLQNSFLSFRGRFSYPRPSPTPPVVVDARTHSITPAPPINLSPPCCNKNLERERRRTPFPPPPRAANFEGFCQFLSMEKKKKKKKRKIFLSHA